MLQNKRYWILMFLQHFSQSENVLLPLWNLKKKRPFARLPKLFMQSLWNFFDMVLLVSMSKERCNPGFSFSKQKLCCNLPPAVHVMIEWNQKGFNFTETVNNHDLNQQRARQFSRFISHFSLKLHTQF